MINDVCLIVTSRIISVIQVYDPSWSNPSHLTERPKIPISHVGTTFLYGILPGQVRFSCVILTELLSSHRVSTLTRMTIAIHLSPS